MFSAASHMQKYSRPQPSACDMASAPRPTGQAFCSWAGSRLCWSLIKCRGNKPPDSILALKIARARIPLSGLSCEACPATVSSGAWAWALQGNWVGRRGQGSEGWREPTEAQRLQKPVGQAAFRERAVRAQGDKLFCNPCALLPVPAPSSRMC